MLVRVPGTGIAYAGGAISLRTHYAMTGTVLASVVWCTVICLRACYAMTGTDPPDVRGGLAHGEINCMSGRHVQRGPQRGPAHFRRADSSCGFDCELDRRKLQCVTQQIAVGGWNVDDGGCGCRNDDVCDASDASDHGCVMRVITVV
eukprot:3140614-Rhodomonas_salina.1